MFLGAVREKKIASSVFNAVVDPLPRARATGTSRPAEVRGSRDATIESDGDGPRLPSHPAGGVLQANRRFEARTSVVLPRPRSRARGLSLSLWVSVSVDSGARASRRAGGRGLRVSPYLKAVCALIDGLLNASPLLNASFFLLSPAALFKPHFSPSRTKDRISTQLTPMFSDRKIPGKLTHLVRHERGRES